MARKKSKHYCSNPELLKELKYYHETGIMTDELGIMFMNITKRLTGHSYFRYYSNYIKDELMSAAIVRMIEQINMFDITRENANPFAYFTQTAWNCFVLECRKHYKQVNIKRKISIQCFTQIESNPYMAICPNMKESMKSIVEEDDHYTKQRKKKKEESEK